jgi:hypothetical protein
MRAINASIERGGGWETRKGRSAVILVDISPREISLDTKYRAVELVIVAKMTARYCPLQVLETKSWIAEEN